MATGPTVIRSAYSGRIELYEWTLAANESGTPVVVPHKADKTVQGWGTFGGAVSLEGSLEINPATATEFFVLRDGAHGLLSGKTAAFGDIVLTHTYLVRPVAGAGVTGVTVRLMIVGDG